MQPNQYHITALIILAIIIAGNPTHALTIEYKQNIPTESRNILYVGGTGPHNYTTIQEAIDAAISGDTIHIFNGAYNESLWINKSLNIHGESPHKVIINNQASNSGIKLQHTKITIQNLSITNSHNHAININPVAHNTTIKNTIIYDHSKNGIFLNQADNNTIKHNVIHHTQYGIHLVNTSENNLIAHNIIKHTETAISLHTNCHHNTIKQNNLSNASTGIMITNTFFGNYIGKNTIQNTIYGILLKNSTVNHLEQNILTKNHNTGILLCNNSQGTYIRDNQIHNNTNALLFSYSHVNTVIANSIQHNVQAIHLDQQSTNNLIKDNIISQNTLGIYFTNYCEDNNIHTNNIFTNKISIYLENKCNANQIKENNFKRNTYPPSFNDSISLWDKNYWQRPHLFPKPILGTIMVDNQYKPLITFDWQPAKNPYPLKSLNNSSSQTPNEVPEYVKIGDILLMDCSPDSDVKRIWFIPGEHNDHAALYLGNSLFIHASGGGVRTNSYEGFGGINFAFYRVITANQTQIDNALSFAIKRLGARYQVFFHIPYLGRKSHDPFDSHPMANRWYCMELPWASYYSQGIDIDRNGWFPFPQLAWIIGDDIKYDDDTIYIGDE